MVVNGDDVTATGLFVEHYQKNEVVWNGQNGRVVFFQNEMPYDLPSQAAWTQPDGTLGYPAIEVGNGVKTFNAWGMEATSSTRAWTSTPRTGSWFPRRLRQEA